MAPAISIIRALPGALRRTRTGSTIAQRTAMIPAPSASSTVESILFPSRWGRRLPGRTGTRARVARRGWGRSNRRLVQHLLDLCNRGGRDDVHPGVAAHAGVVATAVEVLTANR